MFVVAGGVLWPLVPNFLVLLVARFHFRRPINKPPSLETLQHLRAMSAELSNAWAAARILLRTPRSLATPFLRKRLQI